MRFNILALQTTEGIVLGDLLAANPDKFEPFDTKKLTRLNYRCVTIQLYCTTCTDIIDNRSEAA